MPAYTFAAPSGVVGDVSRTDESNVEPALLIAASGTFAQAFGIPVKYVTGGIQQFNGGAEVPADFAGVLIREVPAISGSNAQGFTNNIPNPVVAQGLLVRGYAYVTCARGTPARGGAVFVQIAANGGVAVGEFCATDDGANAIELSGVTWAVTGKDASNISEIRVAR